MNEESKIHFIKNVRKKINLIRYCGHHCGFCSGRDQCGGCRSEYNICSFATLFPDRICPNGRCVENKGLNGCYECNELPECNIGYYGRENEYAAKAAALFIREYGEECYTATLTNIVESETEYPQSLDVSGSVTNALSVLKRYL